MAATSVEREAKFLVTNLDAIELRLIKNGAILFKPRIKELNLRFDTKDHRLSSQSQVLRLRQDAHSWLTFKSPGSIQDGIPTRREIEFSISDFNAARKFLEALGFSLFQTYEKYRIVYRLNDLKIMLDELPLGNFVEIEGSDIISIQNGISDLNLDWEKNIKLGYLAIYENLCLKLGIEPVALTFENYEGYTFPLELLNLRPADQ